MSKLFIFFNITYWLRKPESRRAVPASVTVAWDTSSKLPSISLSFSPPLLHSSPHLDSTSRFCWFYAQTGFYLHIQCLLYCLLSFYLQHQDVQNQRRVWLTLSHMQTSLAWVLEYPIHMWSSHPPISVGRRIGIGPTGNRWNGKQLSHLDPKVLIGVGKCSWG